MKNNIQIQNQLLLNIQCAENSSSQLLGLLGKVVEEKKQFESADEDSVGEFDLF